MQTAIYSLGALRALEERARHAGVELMPRAARAIVDWVREHYPPGAHILLAAGPGNNGGDAILSAPLLKEAGYRIDLLLTQAPVLPAVRQALQHLEQQGVTGMATLPADQPRPDLLIDGLFGIGIDRPFSAPWCALIDSLNQLQAPTLSLDTPSGLDAYRGSSLNAVIRASTTLTFLCHKPGLLTGEGVDLAGNVILAPLGVHDWGNSLPEGGLNQPSTLGLIRKKNSHKGSYGCVVVAGGAEGMLGAALLAGRSALYGGAGKVYVCALDQRLAVDPCCPELMLRNADTLPACSVLAIGPGLGQGPAARQLLADALHRRESMVLDADALNLLADMPALQAEMARQALPRILTPHPAEAARLLGISTAEIQADRPEAARALSSRLNSVVILKGAGSLICRQDGYYRVNTTGGPALACAGQGDVLTGLIAALLAQGLSPFDAASLATHVHGLTASRYVEEYQGPIGLSASQSARSCARILNQLQAQESSGAADHAS